MSTWILLAIAAQFLLAVVAIVDKYIVSGKKAVVRPFVYAFYTSLISGAWIVVYLFGHIPFAEVLNVPSFSDVTTPSLSIVALSLVAAYTFFVALVSLFKALRHADASDVVPVVGAISAIASFGLSYVFLATRLSFAVMLGVLLLALGTALVSRYQFKWQTAFTCVHAGIFFAIHYVAIKGVFNETTFDDGFFWSRVAFVVVALSMLLVPRYVLKITSQTKKTGKRGGLLILSNKVLAGISTLLILKATELGDVSVVQALGALQFIFILLFMLFWGRKTPKEYGENVTGKKEMLRKVLFVSIITLGFAMLFV